MKLDNVHILIEKYFDGNTSLEEEKDLRSFFSQEGQEYPEDLKQYKVLFDRASDDEMYLDETFTEELWQNIQSEPSKPALVIKPIFRWLAVAAASMIFFALVTRVDPNSGIDKPIAVHGKKEMTKKEAVIATKQTLAFVAHKLNKGRKPMKNVAAFYQIQNVVKKR